MPGGCPGCNSSFCAPAGSARRRNFRILTARPMPNGKKLSNVSNPKSFLFSSGTAPVVDSPWLDPEREFDDFLQTDLKPTALNSIDEVHLIFSEDDDEAERQTKDRLLAAYPQIVFHDYLNFGHFPAAKPGGFFQ